MTADTTVADEPILLDAVPAKYVLDFLGALALFASVALAIGATEAVAATASVGALVVVSRLFRMLGANKLRG